MKIICHRGNTFGPDPENENKVEVIEYCIRQGFDVEIDLWMVDGDLFLGHDKPQYQVDWDYLRHRKANLWVHAKNFQAITALNNYYLNFFWHEDDKYAITSHKYIWTHPNTFDIHHSHQQVLLDFSPSVDFDFYRRAGVAGVCVDYV